MNAEHVSLVNKTEPSEPLFASPWIALFLVIRRELLSGLRDR